MMSFVTTAVGTFMSVAITTLFAYAIAENVPGMKVLSFLLIFTMFFNGGIVAMYYTYMRVFRIRNTMWALLLPNLLMNAIA
jgi:putative aldouronate transport system permease protein